MISALAFLWDAPCTSAGGDAMFPDPNQRAETAYAKSICTNCEVRIKCLEYALANGEGDGIWGGLSAADRKNLLRRRRKEAARQDGANRAPLEEPRIQGDQRAA